MTCYICHRQRIWNATFLQPNTVLLNSNLRPYAKVVLLVFKSCPVNTRALLPPIMIPICDFRMQSSSIKDPLRIYPSWMEALLGTGHPSKHFEGIVYKLSSHFVNGWWITSITTPTPAPHNIASEIRLTSTIYTSHLHCRTKFLRNNFAKTKQKCLLPSFHSLATPTTTP